MLLESRAFESHESTARGCAGLIAENLPILEAARA